MGTLPRMRVRHHCVWSTGTTRSGFARTLTLLSYLVVLLAGCRSAKAPAGPSIEFTQIPPAAQGGRERVDTITGRALGAHPGQRIVVFAKSGPWWVQPDSDHPFVTIQQDSKWSTSTHLGYEYAALLVEPAYRPPPTMDATPTQGGSVVAVTIVKGVGSLPPNPTKSLTFSGYDWKVRTVSADAGGGLNNLYDAGNAWTDASGSLHLRISKKFDQWTCAQVSLTRSLGYGTYVAVVRDISRLEPAVVFSMHTYDEGGQEYYRQMGVEISHWGDATAPSNAQYGVVPLYIPGNVAHFTAPSGTLTYSLRWEFGRATLETFRGSVARTEAAVVSRHVFTSGIPTPGEEVFLFMLYIVPSKHPLQEQTEVVVEKFEYLPE